MVTAAYLARAGRRVLVLERRELVGGCAVTEEIWPGYQVSTASYLTSLLQERVIRDLELARFGYRVDAKDPAFFSPFPDGRYLFMWQDREKTLAEIAKFSRRDAAAYPAYEDYLERLSQVVEGLLLTTPPEFPPESLGRFCGLPEAGGEDARRESQRYGGAGQDLHAERGGVFGPMVRVGPVKVTLATDAVIGANGGPRSSGTAYILLHHVMGGVGGHRGLWGFVRGGMGGCFERDRGVGGRAGAPRSAPTRAVEITDPRSTAARAWCGTGGRGRDRAPSWWISNLTPQLPFLHLIDRDALPGDFVDSDPQVSERRHVVQNQSGVERLAEISAPFPVRRGRSIGPRCTSARR